MEGRGYRPAGILAISPGEIPPSAFWGPPFGTPLRYGGYAWPPSLPGQRQDQLNHRFMLPLTTPSAPFPSASFWNSPPLRGLCMAPITARAASRPAISIAPAPSSLIRSTSPRGPFYWRIRASPLGRTTEGKAGQESTAQGSSERWPRNEGLRGVVGGSGRERSLRSD